MWLENTRVCVHAFSRVQLFATPWTLPDSSVHGISQARILEWVAISFSRGPSWPKDWTQVSCFSCSGKKKILYHCTTWEAYEALTQGNTHTHTHTHTKACYLGGMIFKLSLCNPELFLLCFISFMSERFGDSSDYSLAQWKTVLL